VLGAAVAALLVVGVVVVALRARESPGDVVAETARNLRYLRSGELSMRARAAPRGTALDRGVGFSLTGPFALAEPGRLPMAEVTLTRSAGANRASADFVSTGGRAYVRVAGTAYALGAARERALRGSASSPGPGRGLDTLDIESWVRDPHLEDGPTVGGTKTDRITSKVDVARVADGLLSLTRPGARALTPRDADQLERATRSARLELLAGAEDRLLRRLTVDLELSADVPPPVRTALGPLGGARFALGLEVKDPNRAVRVRAPLGARPAAELPGGAGPALSAAR
jgi:hypothetical protein